MIERFHVSTLKDSIAKVYQHGMVLLGSGLMILSILPIRAFGDPVAAATQTQGAVNRTLPSFSPPSIGASISENPSVEEIERLHLFAEPLIPAKAPTEDQNRQLAAALQLYAQHTIPDDYTALETFVTDQSDSPWTPSLLFNLGMEYYNTGWYSKALDAYQKAWSLLKDATDPAVKALADRAVSELAEMYARIGRMDKLSSLLTSIQRRVIVGSAKGKVSVAKQGLWSMQNRPGVSFRCGPLALDRILAYQAPEKAGDLLVRNSRSTTNGFSLSQVAALSRGLGMNYQMAFRSPGAELLTPAVVNWKVGHYAALIREENGLYLLQDPTFQNDTWVTRRALDAEASGYFLVRSGALPPGWRPVSEDEGKTVWGRGQVAQENPHANTPSDMGTGSPQCGGMAVHSIKLLLVSLNLRDNPVGYTPPVGPPVKLVVTYNEDESDQPATFTYSNLGQQWTFNWLAYISDNPSAPSANVNYYTDGGGTLPFTGFGTNSQSFAPQIQSQAILTRTSPNSYVMLFPDGSEYVFAQPNATNGTSRNVFMTSMVDPQGNAVQISYDSNFRVVALTDAIGQVTTLSYGLGSDPLKITQVTDPFGRFATFNYDASNRLAQITDCIGLTSKFTYDSGTSIQALTTPYGTNSYASGESGSNKWIVVTYPDGEQERVEFSQSATVNIPDAGLTGTVPTGMTTLDEYLEDRNTYFWNRRAYVAFTAKTNDFSTAHIYHWLHSLDYTTAMGVLDSEKQPLENRVWYNYAGQPSALQIGTSSEPSAIGRVLDDGTTQLSTFQYNALGKLTNSVDPLGRAMTYIYSTNLVDLLEVHQTTGANNDLLGKFVYNSEHLPVTIVDAAGQVTTNTYNARGQLLTSTDPLGETTTCNYDTNGYLLSVVGPFPGTNDMVSFSYDTVGRVRTATGVDGYTLSYSYDNFDRVTNITYPDGTFEALTYSNLDLAVVQDRLGRQTVSTYDALRQRIAVQDPLNRVTRFEYCGCGAMSGLIDPMGRRTSWEYDIEGRKVAKQYADGSRVLYNYENTTSRLHSKFDEKGQETVYQYYPDNNLQSVSYPNATIATPTVNYTYDPNYNRCLTMQDGIGATMYSYNPISATPSLGAGQLASVSGPLPNSAVTYQYDQLGRMINRAINGVPLATRYDLLGRPIAVTNALGAFQYSYVGATARLASEAYPNGQTNLYTYYNNLGDDRLQQIQHLKPNGALLSGFGYGYNAVGQITTWSNQWDTISTRVWLPSYDAADQLTNVVSAGGPSTVTNYTYAYDLAGNRLLAATNGVQTTYSYNALNQLQSGSAASTNAPTYEWDAENRLTAINQGVNRSEFSYDGLGRRVEIVEKTNGVVASNNYYLWCGTDICEIRDSTGTNVIRRLYPQGESLAGFGNSTNYFYTMDHLGSIREASDASGVLATRYDYDPYGQEAVIQQNLSTTLAYTGFFLHSRSGLYLALYRPLDSGAGRWLSRDPMGEAFGVNMYSYVGQDPLDRTDPLGLYFFWDDLAFTAGGAVIGGAGAAISDYIAGRPITWQDVVGGAAGGAVSGELSLYASPFVANVAGGIVGNVVNQYLNIHYGDQCGWDINNLAANTTLSVATGFIAPLSSAIKIPGINGGSGSFLQVYNQLITKARLGQIGNVTSTSVGKMVVSSTVEGSPTTAENIVGGALLPSPSGNCSCK